MRRADGRAACPLTMISILPAIAPPDAPLAPGWWPLPPGWWVLGMGLFVLAVWIMVRLAQRIGPGRRRRQPIDVRVMALAALDDLERRSSASERETAYRLNEILRAALLDSRDPVRWHPFAPRDDLGVNAEEWAAFWDELEMRYRPLPGEREEDDGVRRRRWLAMARKWIEMLPDQNGVRMHL